MILVKIPLLTGRDLFRQRWHIYYRNGSYHFVNKAHLTKLLEQSYDAVDREVTLGNQYDYCCWELFDIDPFHPSNIEYIRIKKYENSDTITTVVQSAIQSAPYFKLLKYDGEEFDFIINSSLINQLNSLEIAYSNLPTAYPPNAPYYFHVAKLWVDTLVADGILEYGSPEYYGIWASSGNNQLEAVQNFTDQLELAVAVITVAYSVYNVVTSIRALSQAVNSTQTISNSQYVTYYNQTRSNYLSGGTGYSSFEQAKSALGSAGSNKAWHHIVEQNQISGSGFSATNIHNTKNLISIPSGYSGSVHSQITGHYASIQPYTNGMTVRQWLAGQSFQVQFEYGLQQLNNYGTVLATETGWAFIPN